MFHAHVRYPTHYVEITHDDLRVTCFKYNKKHCDLESFTEDQIDQIADYIMTPLPRLVWYVNVDEDSGDSE